MQSAEVCGWGLLLKGPCTACQAARAGDWVRKGLAGAVRLFQHPFQLFERQSFLVQVALHRVSQAGQPDAQGGGKQPDWAQILEYWTRCARWHLCKYAPRVFVAKSHSVCARTSFQNSVERPIRLLATGSLLFDVAALSTGCPAASAIDDSLILRGGRPLAGASDLRSGRV